MEAEQTHVCPHYRPYTLWWNEKSGEGNIPCPPDFKFPCFFTEMERAAKGFFESEIGTKEERDRVNELLDLMHLDELGDDFVTDLMMDFEEELAETEYEQHLEDIKIGIMEANAALVSSMEQDELLQTA